MFFGLDPVPNCEYFSDRKKRILDFWILKVQIMNDASSISSEAKVMEGEIRGYYIRN
jgi:hypothetical protein